jgi:catechol 2,3-dioxygenase-like lactoylglutathione lyase family enzyme
MQQRVTVITLGVSDLARARRFYEALGWETQAEPNDDVVFFQTGDMVLSLWDREAGRGQPRHGHSGMGRRDAGAQPRLTRGGRCRNRAGPRSRRDDRAPPLTPIALSH